MRKITVALLIIASLFSLAGCGDGVQPNDKTPAQQTKPELSQATKQNAANITETVIFSANDIIVTAKSISYDGWLGPGLDLLIENNSPHNITVQARNASINGLMADPTFSADIAAGKKANETMSFMSSKLEQAGITTIKEIEFVLHIFDSDTWDDIVNSGVIVLTTDASGYVQAFDDSGTVVYDEDNIKIVAKKLGSEESFWGAELYLYIENNTEQDITVQTRDVSINGYMVDPIFSAEIVRGKKAFDSLTFMESDLTENGITDIQEIELRFHIFESESWETIKDSDIVKTSF